MTSYNLRSVVFNVLAFLLIVAFPVNLFAWGPDGHKIVARIAEKHLTAKARTAILSQKLLEELPDGSANCDSESIAEELACVANWADTVRDNVFVRTTKWHFVNISLADKTYKPEQDCPDNNEKGICGIKALAALIDFLESNQGSFSVGTFTPDAAKFDRRIAMRFLVHIVGDLHQPLHTVKEGGGRNTPLVTFIKFSPCLQMKNGKCVKGGQPSLHKVWDSKIITTLLRQKQKNEKTYADLLDSEIKESDVDAFEDADSVEWLLEAHEIAIEDDDKRVKSLKKIKEQDGKIYPRINSNYVKDNTPSINLQLKRAGIRLAKILNEIFD